MNFDFVKQLSSDLPYYNKIFKMSKMWSVEMSFNIIIVDVNKE
jgi:hypothetical protein